jgi:DNA repair photolyase
VSTRRAARGTPGRGAVSNPEGRFDPLSVEPVEDGWPGDPDEGDPGLPTELIPDSSRTVIARNDSPDVPFDQAINPYRGCEHGCIYCYARPTHSWLGMSPGLDFETRILYKPRAAELLKRELGSRSYRCRVLALGSNTDPYQPAERRLGITRRLLEVLAECDHPVSIVTKASLIERDLDLLSAMAEKDLASAMISVTTLDDGLKRIMEPRTAAPARRLATIRALADAGVPVGVLVAPVIPVINDHEIEAILEAAAAAGADSAAHILLRLPHEVANLFREWLDEHFPERAGHVMSLLQAARGGRDNDPRFGVRMTGVGPWADLVHRRFSVACRRVGLRVGEARDLDTGRFRPPAVAGPQMPLL